MDETQSIRPKPDDNHFAALLTEYTTSLAYMEKTLENIIQIVGFTTGALAVIIAYFFDKSIQLSVAVAWLLPGALLVIYSLIIIQTGAFISYLWSTRFAAERINSLMPEIVLARYIPEYPSASFFSLFRGDVRFTSLSGVLLLAASATLVYVVMSAFKIVYSSNHSAGICLLLLYSLLALLETSAVYSVLYELPRRHRVLIDQLRQMGRTPTRLEISLEIIHSTGHSIRRLASGLLPRPHDFLVKAPFFFLGFVISYLVIGLSAKRLPIVNVFFSASPPMVDVSQAPKVQVYILGLAFLIIAEFLLQQGKLLWDDIRDVNRDRYSPLNRGRAVASGLMSIPAAKAHMTWRVILAFLLGYLMAGPILVWVFVAILVHQVIYELWAKPRGSSNPLLALLVIAFNIPLRFIAGAVSASDSSWNTPVILLVFVMFWFLSFAGMSLQWRLEAEDKRLQQEGFQRLQSKRFLVYSIYWQNLGLVAAVVVSYFATIAYSELVSNLVVIPSLLMTIVVELAQSTQTFISLLLHYVPTIGPIIAFIGTEFRASNFTLVGAVTFVIVGIVIIATLVFLIYLVLWPLRWILNIFSITRKWKRFFVLLSLSFFVLAIVMLIIALSSPDALFAIAALIPFNLGSMLLFQVITYRDYTGEKIMLKGEKFGRAFNSFIFEADSKVRIKTLWQIVTTD